MARKNKPSASNPQGLSDQEIVDQAIAVLATRHILMKSTHAGDAQFLAWISSDHNIRKAVISYTALSHWDLSMVKSLEKAQQICRAKESQIAAQLALDEIMRVAID